MAKYPIRMVSGAPQMVEARRFSYYVQSIQHWFIVHKTSATYTVSDWSSGNRICDVPFITLSAHLGDEVSAAKSALKAMFERVGEARVRSVLAGAEPLRGK